jgi:hypothetical protein
MTSSPNKPLPEKPASDPGEFQQHVRDYSRAASRWVWASLTRDSILAGLKTLAWLVPLTFLIWVYAERQQQVSATLTIPIKLVSSDPANRLVELKMQGNSVIAQLSGPQSRIDELRKQIQLQGNSEPSVVITVSASSYTSGSTVPIDSALMLSQTSQFIRSGVTIISCQPEKLPVYIDQYVDREAEVQAPADAPAQITNLDFVPSTVLVRAPEHSLPDAKLVVHADFAKLPGLETPGPHDALVTFLENPWGAVSITPASVKVHFDVKQTDVSYELPSMPVFQDTPINLLNGYKLKCDASLSRVPLTGPPEQIEFLKQETTTRPHATLSITRDDLANLGQPSRKRLTFSFPEGAKSVYVDPNYATQHEFEFTIVPLSE